MESGISPCSTKAVYILGISKGRPYASTWLAWSIIANIVIIVGQKQAALLDIVCNNKRVWRNLKIGSM